MIEDRWNQPVAGSASSVAAWDRAWGQLLHFTGDPLAELSDANDGDDSFVLGPVFCALYLVLAGSPLDSPALLGEVARAGTRLDPGDQRGTAHVEALDTLVAGDFGDAGRRWAAWAERSGDFAALRFAHDVFLHCGDAPARLASTASALASWDSSREGYGFLLGMHSFSLEEVGRYGEALVVGGEALELDPLDAWALHALAHVHEMVDDTDAALRLLGGDDRPWHRQDLLSTHIWWHLAIRLIAAGDLDRALAVFDDLLPAATSAFRLCDLGSLLWRAELAGGDVGDRWDPIADRWAAVDEIHTCGFLDLHAALAFARRPDHPGAAAFHAGLAASHPEPVSENDRTFAEVVRPLVAAVAADGRGDRTEAVRLIDRVGDAHQRLGGSVAQRDLIRLTRLAAVAATTS